MRGSGGAAGVDIATGSTPFAWLVVNIQQNLLNDRASEFGVAPAHAYVHLTSILWAGAPLLMLLALWRGWQHAPLLIVAAIVNVAFHSIIAHKEYRFIFLSIPLLIIAAGVGSADWVELMRQRPAWRRWALPVVCAGWLLLSLGLSGATYTMRHNWMLGTAEAKLAADLDADPEFCGLALYGMHDPFVPGRGQLAINRPVYSFYPADPLAKGQLPALLQRHKSEFNRIIAPAGLAGELPAEFSSRTCALASHEINTCIFVRRRLRCVHDRSLRNQRRAGASQRLAATDACAVPYQQINRARWPVRMVSSENRFARS